MAGVLQDGRTATVCGPVARRREHGGAVPGVRYLAQDRLQDLHRRYQDCGLEGLTDRSRAGPTVRPTSLPFQIETRIVQLKKEHPSWGAPKIREKLRRLNLGVQTPAISTVHAVLDRHGLVSRGRRRRHKAQGTGLTTPTSRTICGAPTTRASSCSPIGATATHLRSPTSPVAICCAAMPWQTTRESSAFTRLRARLQGLWPAARDPHRQRHPLRQHARFLRPEPALGVVAAARHPHRTHPARPSTAERPPRAHAPDPEEGSHQPAAKNFLQQQAKFDASSTATTTSGRTRRSACATRPSSTSRQRGPIAA